MKLLERFKTSIIRLILSLNTLGALSTFAEAQDTLRILAFGDSVTAGYQLSKEVAFANRLQLSLRKQGYDVEVVNSGVSGDTSLQGKNRVSWALKQGGSFDVVLLALGANDGLRNSSLEAMRSNLSHIVEVLQKSGARVYLMGMQLPLNYAAAYRQNFEKVYRDLSQKYSLKFYPFLLEGVAMKSEYNLQDLIHPNAKGHVEIAKRLESWLKKDAEFKKLLENSKVPVKNPKP